MFYHSLFKERKSIPSVRFSGVKPPTPLFPAASLFHKGESRPPWLTLLPSAAILRCSARTLQQFCCPWHYPATFRNLTNCSQQFRCPAALSRCLSQPHRLSAEISLLCGTIPPPPAASLAICSNSAAPLSPHNRTATCCYHVRRLPDVAVVRDRNVTLTH